MEPSCALLPTETQKRKLRKEKKTKGGREVETREEATETIKYKRRISKSLNQCWLVRKKQKDASFAGMCTYYIPKEMWRVHGVEETNDKVLGLCCVNG